MSTIDEAFAEQWLAQGCNVGPYSAALAKDWFRKGAAYMAERAAVIVRTAAQDIRKLAAED